MARNPDKGLYVTLDTGDSTYITRAKPLSIKVSHFPLYPNIFSEKDLEIQIEA
jgi:hypothetical protein